MNQQFVELISSVLAKLGYTAEQAWPMMVRHTWIKSTVDTMWGLAFLIMSFIVMYMFRKRNNERPSDGELIAFLVGIVLFFIGSAVIAANIPDVLAPEGATILKTMRCIR